MYIGREKEKGKKKKKMHGVDSLQHTTILHLMPTNPRLLALICKPDMQKGISS